MHLVSYDTVSSELDMGQFLLTQSYPTHKYLVLNRTRKLCATNYSNADF